MITEQDIIVDHLAKEAIEILNQNITIGDLIREDKQRMIELLDDADIKEPYASICIDHWFEYMIEKTSKMVKTKKEAS